MKLFLHELMTAKTQVGIVIRGQDDAGGRLPELHCLSKA